jgi:T5SS/PEP-CTERM-associated repeat protein
MHEDKTMWLTCTCRGPRRAWVAGCVMLLAVGYGGVAPADEAGDVRSWVNAAGGVFDEPDNWLDGLVPTATDEALFNIAATYTVAFADDDVTDRLVIRDGEVTFDLAGWTYELTYPSAALNDTDVSFHIGMLDGDVAMLTLQQGILNARQSQIATAADSQGAVTVGSNTGWVNSDRVYVGFSGTGVLTIADGGSVTNTSGLIGFNSGSAGVVVVSGKDVDGNASTWTNTGALVVGWVGTATLAIADGASVTNRFGTIGYWNGSHGTVTVSGHGSTWTNTEVLRVSNYGDGVLTIADGGLVSSPEGIIADFRLSEGAVTVTGTDALGNPSAWNNAGFLYVGRSGKGSLTIADGGQVSNTRGYIGFSPFASEESTATVTGTDANGNPSTWTNTGNLSVGPGTLTIADGAQVTSARGSVGFDPDRHTAASVVGTDANGNPSAWIMSNMLGVSTGTLIIADGGYASSVGGGTTGGTIVVTGTSGDGQASTWFNVSSLSVGRTDTGTLTIADGGLVFSSSGSISSSIGGQGTVTVTGAGSTWTSSGDVIVGGSAIQAEGVGTLIVSDGGEVIVEGSKGLIIWQTSKLIVDGGTVTGNVTNHGLVSPGDSPGVLAIDGDYTQQADGEMRIELAGINPGSEHDHLQISGHFSIAGTLEVKLLEDFVPSVGDAFEVIGYSSHFGQFTDTQGLTHLGGFPGLYLDVDYGESALTLIASAMLGDADLDGQVTRDDFNTLASHFGQPGGWMQGDFNGDGIIDRADFNSLAANFGRSLDVNNAPVPEPATFLLFGLGGLLAMRRPGTGQSPVYRQSCCT